MSSIFAWSLIAVSLQTLVCLVISWSVLGCKMAPDPNELRELSLMKLLYLYDPVACTNLIFYNVTSPDRRKTILVWPLTNSVASSFRTKLKVYLVFHIVWFLLAIANASQGQRGFGFYTALLPFTISGVGVLVLDLVYTTLFLMDAKYTDTEGAIFRYVHKKIKILETDHLYTSVEYEDTSWIALLMAYVSCRGVVLYIFNFWIIKDNYFSVRSLYFKTAIKKKSRRHVNYI